MQYQLRRIDPVRSANILAIVYAILFLVIMLLVAPFVLVFDSAGAFEDADVAVPGIGLLLVLYPIFGAVAGWIGGALMAVLYNLVVRWTGGLLFEMDPTSEASEL